MNEHEPITTPMGRASFLGETRGTIKELSGYRKGYRLPDLGDPRADEFIQKAGATELHEAGEALFQRIKDVFGYKRKEISLSQEGAASIQTVDFCVHLSLVADPDNNRHYLMSTEVTDFIEPDVLQGPQFADVFNQHFDRLVFEFPTQADIEEVIDRVEDLDQPDRVTVSYPSDASECTVSLVGFTSKLLFDTNRLTLIGPQKLPVSDLVHASGRLQDLLGAEMMETLFKN